MSRHAVKILESVDARATAHPFSRALVRELGPGTLFAGSFLRTSMTSPGVTSCVT